MPGFEPMTQGSAGDRGIMNALMYYSQSG
jgi:hypothetical protein